MADMKYQAPGYAVALKFSRKLTQEALPSSVIFGKVPMCLNQPPQPMDDGVLYGRCGRRP